MTELEQVPQEAEWPERLRSHFGWEARPVLTKFTHGQSNPTFHVDLPDWTFVLRKKPAGALLPTAHDVHREFRVLSGLALAGYPAPRPLSYCADEGIVGTPFYLMEFIDGRLYQDFGLSRDQGPEDRRAALGALLRALALLHRVDVDSVGLSEFGPKTSYFQRQSKRWSKQYEASMTRDIGACSPSASMRQL